MSPIRQAAARARDRFKGSDPPSWIITPAVNTLSTTVLYGGLYSRMWHYTAFLMRLGRAGSRQKREAERRRIYMAQRHRNCTRTVPFSNSRNLPLRRAWLLQVAGTIRFSVESITDPASGRLLFIPAPDETGSSDLGRAVIAAWSASSPTSLQVRNSHGR